MASATVVFTEGPMRQTCLYQLKNVTTGDTVDVGAQFSKVTIANLAPISVNIPNFPPTPTILGTILTIVQVGLANDSMYLLVSGAAK